MSGATSVLQDRGFGLSTAPDERHELIDALRGFALLGILLVNIQSFTWGVGAPTMGLLYPESPVRDIATVYLTTLLLEFKVYPVFCICFGYGFAIMAKRWRASGLDASAVKRRMARRLNFMLLLGLAHGFIVWFGDILARYAIAGYIMARYADFGPRRLLSKIRSWGIITVVVTGFFAVVSWLAGYAPPDNEAIAEMLAHARAYSAGSYLDTISPRVKDYAVVLFTWVFLVPQAVLLFLLGAFVARMGWLRDPARHREKWLRVLVWSFALGVVPSIVAANHLVEWSTNPLLVVTGVESIAINLVPVMALAYVAAFALLAPLTIGKILVRLLAPLGRMALTNYLLQTLAMSVLLMGYGFGLANAGQFAIALMAIGVFVAQAAFSHWYLRHHAQGPMERLWRRYTQRAA
ncbi:MAG: DUF418 domain-containing protein [Burkholderiales bacterium]